MHHHQVRLLPSPCMMSTIACHCMRVLLSPGSFQGKPFLCCCQLFSRQSHCHQFIPAPPSRMLGIYLLLSLAAAAHSLIAHPPSLAPTLLLPNGPQSQCSFPRLCKQCKMNSATVRIAQSLIANALNETTFVPDGVFTDAFKSDITRFQLSFYLPNTSGVLDQPTWLALAGVSSVSPSSSSVAISALQRALSALGWSVNASGKWDRDTSAAFAAFRSSRSLPPPTTPPVTTPRDWLLLASWCNPTTGSFWFDAGWPQGEMDVLTLACLRYAGFEFATFECWRGRPGQVRLCDTI